MRWAVTALVALGAVVVVAVAVAMATTGASSRAAQLRLLEDAPLTIRGTGFKPRERVRLTIRAGRAAVRHAVAGMGGGFTMRVAGMSADTCTGFSVTATGAGGSRASLKRAPGQCPLP